MKQIKKIGVLQTAKVISICYFIGSTLILVPVALMVLAQGGKTKEGVSWLFFLIAPFVYLGLGFIALCAGAFIYNLISPKLGGIEIELSEDQ